MHLHYTIALSSSSFVLRPPLGRILTRVILQPASATVYVGPTPSTSLTLTGGVGAISTAIINFPRGASLELPPGVSDILPGQTVTAAAGIPSNTYVKSIVNGTLTLSANLTGAIATTDTLTVADPVVNATNGISITSGTRYELSNGWRFAPEGLTIFASGTTNVVLQYDFT